MCCSRWSSEQVRTVKLLESAGCSNRRATPGDSLPLCTGTCPPDQPTDHLCARLCVFDWSSVCLYRDRVQVAMEDDMMMDMVVSDTPTLSTAHINQNYSQFNVSLCNNKIQQSNVGPNYPKTLLLWLLVWLIGDIISSYKISWYWTLMIY